MKDWDDIRFFLSVVDSGSTLVASRKLRVSQTTVARRIAALEAATGFELFDRKQSGFTLNDTATAFVEPARAMAEAAGLFRRAADAQARGVGRSVLVEAPEIMATTLIYPILTEFYEAHPRTVVEIAITREMHDQGIGESDIAIRSFTSPLSEHIVGRRICRQFWSAYCSPEYAAHHGTPADVTELADHRLISGGGNSLIGLLNERWIEAAGFADRVVIRQNTVNGIVSVAQSGVGVAFLPCIVAEGDSRLVRCFPPRPAGTWETWLVTRGRARRTPEVRAVSDFLFKKLRAKAMQLDIY